MISSLPPLFNAYLIRAIHQCMIDEGMLPEILVNSRVDGVEVPSHFVNPDGSIILNIGYAAAKDLVISNDCITFSSSFGGMIHAIYIPTYAVIGIRARGEDFLARFPCEVPPKFTGDNNGAPRPKKKGAPTLRIVK